jgi:hypothetical protein
LTANFREVFYPDQQAHGDEVKTHIKTDRYDLPRSESISDDDDQIREMETLLAEIGQDVSELKVSVG